VLLSLASLSYFGYEKPVQKLIRKWVEKPIKPVMCGWPPDCKG
jgi:peptidoglycan/LPS O-acetylase OafA/YrhL